ncbi:malto-oligosyltrehalose synthase [Nitrospira sp. Kam-Ns4a]
MSGPPAPRIPVSTYRLQFNRAFTFADAARLVSYLDALGITDCYCSSYLMAMPGSEHGYDVVDPTRLNPELGSEEDYQVFVAALKERGMGQILDVVSNHMGIGRAINAWWADVLEHGPAARYARFFDIDWHPVKRELEDKVLLPILGDLYGLVLENGDIQLEYEAGAFFIRYYEHRLPVAPKSWVRILSHRLDELLKASESEDPALEELQSILTALGHLPARGERDPRRVAERYREKAVVQRRLATLVDASPAVASFLQENLRLFNGVKGDPASFDLLDALLNDQAYRLAFWRVAAEEINYRRFFDINELGAIRMEDAAVFEAVHRLIFRLVREGAVTGLRIDHADGLYDPADYFQRLQAWARETLVQTEDRAEPPDRPLYVVAEKILGKDEALPAEWLVHGTTGYDFLNLVNGLFVDSANRRAFDALYARFAGVRTSFDELVYECKNLIMHATMASELNVLGHQLNRLSERDRRSRDFTLNSLTRAIREIIACFPVYRTYLSPAPGARPTERDEAYIRQAVAKAKRRNPALSGLVFDFVQDLLLKGLPDRSPQDEAERLRFVTKFQQTTSPVTAKGIEDTAFYRYNRLLSLNEVGGAPDQFGVPVALFHQRMRERQAHWPHAFSATSTHDTKRSEDVRARLNVLSEMPRIWSAQLALWSKLNRKRRARRGGQAIPDRNEEYFLYQTLVGAWPFGPLDEAAWRDFRERIQGVMTKALREAKVHTSWVNPDPGYEEAVRAFVAALLSRDGPNPFLEAFRPFQAAVARYGAVNSLAQVLLKVAAPGVPDFYQGTELWDFSLVDPDNRRPVDYARRVRLLAELDQACARPGDARRELVRDLVRTFEDGRIKLYVTATALRYRRAQAALFREGEYVPLESGGPKRDHVCAFTRLHGERAAVVVVPRLVAGLAPEGAVLPFTEEVWGDTWIAVPSWRPQSEYRNLFTDERLFSETTGDRQTLPVAKILGEFPVALLERLA